MVFSRQQALHESSSSMPGPSELSKDGTEKKECSAGAGVSFSTTIKTCPSCFAILVPIAKEYMHSF